MIGQAIERQKDARCTGKGKQRTDLREIVQVQEAQDGGGRLILDGWSGGRSVGEQGYVKKVKKWQS